jgi:hypothetical protein
MMFLLQSAQTIINAQLRAGDGIKSYAYTCMLNPYSGEQPRVMRANVAILRFTSTTTTRYPPTEVNSVPGNQFDGNQRLVLSIANEYLAS